MGKNILQSVCDIFDVLITRNIKSIIISILFFFQKNVSLWRATQYYIIPWLALIPTCSHDISWENVTSTSHCGMSIVVLINHSLLLLSVYIQYRKETGRFVRMYNLIHISDTWTTKRDVSFDLLGAAFKLAISCIKNWTISVPFLNCQGHLEFQEPCHDLISMQDVLHTLIFCYHCSKSQVSLSFLPNSAFCQRKGITTESPHASCFNL